MPLYREQTKKGEFLVETGKFSGKQSEFEQHYWSQLSDCARWQTTWELFVNYHLSHGYKPSQLRLDRTVVEFGRRPSIIPSGRRSRRGKIRRT